MAEDTVEVGLRAPSEFLHMVYMELARRGDTDPNSWDFQDDSAERGIHAGCTALQSAGTAPCQTCSPCHVAQEMCSGMFKRRKLTGGEDIEQPVRAGIGSPARMS